MQRYHFPGKLIRLLEATMNGVQCKVRVSNLTSELFESHWGLRQGDGLSCLLFNITLEGVIRGAGLDNDIRARSSTDLSNFFASRMTSTRSDRIFLGIESSNLPNPVSPNTMPNLGSLSKTFLVGHESCILMICSSQRILPGFAILSYLIVRSFVDLI